MKKRKEFSIVRYGFLKKAVVTTICSLCICGAVSFVCNMQGLYLQAKGKSEINRVIADSDYDKFNENYKNEEKQRYMDEYLKGNITETELEDRIASIKDYNKTEYIKNADELSQKTTYPTRS